MSIAKGTWVLNGDVVCAVEAEGVTVLARLIPTGYRFGGMAGPEDPTANGRLMAAAPSLLEALKDVFALIDEGFLVRDVSRDSDPLWALNSFRLVARLKAAYDALEKSEGK